MNKLLVNKTEIQQIYDQEKELRKEELELRLKLASEKKHAFTSKLDLHGFIKNFLGIDIPKKIHPDNKGHTAPFDFVSETFFEMYRSILILANRNGGKTMDLAILEWLFSLFKPGCESTHSGASRDQATKCFKYLEDFSMKNKLMKLYTKQFTKSPHRVTLKNDSEINITTASDKGYNSGHPNKNVIDEVELIKFDILNEAMSMDRTNKERNILGQLILGSTRKKITGTMQYLLDNIESFKLKVYIWNIYDTVEKCKLSKKCEDCDVVDRCKGRARQSCGFYDIGDFIKKATILPDDVWYSQWECKTPGRERLVYANFNDFIHIMTPEHEKNIRNNIEQYPGNWTYYKGIDPGFNSPYAVVFLFKDREDVFYQLDEIYRTELLDDDIADLILKTEEQYPKLQRFNYVASYYDSAQPGSAVSLKRNGITNLRKAKKDVLEGIKEVKQKLRINKKNGKPNYFISKKCINTILEFHMYSHKKDEEAVEKKYDHALDCNRYVIYTSKSSKIHFMKGSI